MDVVYKMSTSFEFRPLTNILTSPYRQLIGEKSHNHSIGGDINNKNFYLENGERPLVKFKNGLYPFGMNYITAICNHYETLEDGYVITKSAASKPKIKIDCKIYKDKKYEELYNTDTISLNKIDGIDDYYIASGSKSLELGDKISNLHGQKGTIVNIVDDDRFEVIPRKLKSDIFDTFPTTLNKIDILMNYNSIVDRGAFGIFVEAGYSYLKKQPHIDSEFVPLGTAVIYDKQDDTYHNAIIGILHYLILNNLSRFIINKYATMDTMFKYSFIANHRDDSFWNKLKSIK